MDGGRDGPTTRLRLSTVRPLHVYFLTPTGTFAPCCHAIRSRQAPSSRGEIHFPLSNRFTVYEDTAPSAPGQRHHRDDRDDTENTMATPNTPSPSTPPGTITSRTRMKWLFQFQWQPSSDCPDARREARDARIHAVKWNELCCDDMSCGLTTTLSRRHTWMMGSENRCHSQLELYVRNRSGTNYNSVAKVKPPLLFLSRST
jgi:hypothetical protein